MSNSLELKNILVSPGDIWFSNEPSSLSAVTGSGIVMTVFDSKRKCGGMCYFIRPLRDNPAEDSPLFACPAIIGLLNKFLATGSDLTFLNAQLHGGAENQKVKGYTAGLGNQNAKVAKEILELKKVNIVGEGIGGTYGRKIVFNTLSGETMIAKVDNIRNSDWYPPLITSRNK